MHVKSDFRLYVSQYKTLQLLVHMVGLAFQFVGDTSKLKINVIMTLRGGGG